MYFLGKTHLWATVAIASTVVITRNVHVLYFAAGATATSITSR